MTKEAKKRHCKKYLKIKQSKKLKKSCMDLNN